jgi:hypothetical protein
LSRRREQRKDVPTMDTPVIDPAKLEAFARRAVGDVNAA